MIMEIAIGVALGFFAEHRFTDLYYWLVDKKRERKTLERINIHRVRADQFTFNSMKEYREFQDASYAEALYPIVYGTVEEVDSYREFLNKKSEPVAPAKKAAAKKTAAPKRTTVN